MGITILPLFAKNQKDRNRKALGSAPIHGSGLGENTQWPKTPVDISGPKTDLDGNPISRSGPVYDSDQSGVTSSSTAPSRTTGKQSFNQGENFIALSGGAQFKSHAYQNQPKPLDDNANLQASPEQQTKRRGQLPVTAVPTRPRPPDPKILIGRSPVTDKFEYMDPGAANGTTLQYSDTSGHGAYHDTAIDGGRSPNPIRPQPVKAFARQFHEFYAQLGMVPPKHKTASQSQTSAGNQGIQDLDAVNA